MPEMVVRRVARLKPLEVRQHAGHELLEVPGSQVRQALVQFINTLEEHGVTGDGLLSGVVSFQETCVEDPSAAVPFAYEGGLEALFNAVRRFILHEPLVQASCKLLVSMAIASEYVVNVLRRPEMLVYFADVFYSHHVSEYILIELSLLLVLIVQTDAEIANFIVGLGVKHVLLAAEDYITSDENAQIIMQGLECLIVGGPDVEPESGLHEMNAIEVSVSDWLSIRMMLQLKQVEENDDGFHMACQGVLYQASLVESEVWRELEEPSNCQLLVEALYQEIDRVEMVELSLRTVANFAMAVPLRLMLGRQGVIEYMIRIMSSPGCPVSLEALCLYTLSVLLEKSNFNQHHFLHLGAMHTTMEQLIASVSGNFLDEEVDLVVRRLNIMYILISESKGIQQTAIKAGLILTICDIMEYHLYYQPVQEQGFSLLAALAEDERNRVELISHKSVSLLKQVVRLFGDDMNLSRMAYLTLVRLEKSAPSEYLEVIWDTMRHIHPDITADRPLVDDSENAPWVPAVIPTIARPASALKVDPEFYPSKSPEEANRKHAPFIMPNPQILPVGEDVKDDVKDMDIQAMLQDNANVHQQRQKEKLNLEKQAALATAMRSHKLQALQYKETELKERQRRLHMERERMDFLETRKLQLQDAQIKAVTRLQAFWKGYRIRTLDLQANSFRLFRMEKVDRQAVESWARVEHLQLLKEEEESLNVLETGIESNRLAAATIAAMVGNAESNEGENDAEPVSSTSSISKKTSLFLGTRRASLQQSQSPVTPTGTHSTPTTNTTSDLNPLYLRACHDEGIGVARQVYVAERAQALQFKRHNAAVAIQALWKGHLTRVELQTMPRASHARRKAYAVPFAKKKHSSVMVGIKGVKHLAGDDIHAPTPEQLEAARWEQVQKDTHLRDKEFERQQKSRELEFIRKQQEMLAATRHEEEMLMLKLEQEREQRKLTREWMQQMENEYRLKHDQEMEWKQVIMQARHRELMELENGRILMSMHYQYHGHTPLDGHTSFHGHTPEQFSPYSPEHAGHMLPIHSPIPNYHITSRNSTPEPGYYRPRHLPSTPSPYSKPHSVTPLAATPVPRVSPVNQAVGFEFNLNDKRHQATKAVGLFDMGASTATGFSFDWERTSEGSSNSNRSDGLPGMKSKPWAGAPLYGSQLPPL